MSATQAPPSFPAATPLCGRPMGTFAVRADVSREYRRVRLARVGATALKQRD